MSSTPSLSDPHMPLKPEPISKSSKPNQTDPSTGRSVTYKKGNESMLVHQQWKKKQEEKEKEKNSKGKSNGNNSSSSITNGLSFLIKWSLVGILISLAAGQFIKGDPIWGYRGKYVRKSYWLPPKQRMFSPAELSLYDGRDPEKPIYLSILGEVYDVTQGARIYGPRGLYHFFAGRDASRAYVTGCFSNHLTHDLRGLDQDSLTQILHWRQFFEDHRLYTKVGSLRLPQIDMKSPIPFECETMPKTPESANPDGTMPEVTWDF